MLSLGRLLDKIKSELKNRISNTELTPKFIRFIGERFYLKGRQASYLTHGLEHQMPKAIPKQRVQLWQESAKQQGTFLTIRFSELLGRRDGLSAEQAKAWLDIAGTQSAFKGIDTEAAQIAEDKALNWKEFVRLYPRKEHRPDHDALEGVIIPIGAKFNLNGQLIYGPRDDSVQDWAKEWSSCGHGLRYYKNVTREQLGL